MKQVVLLGAVLALGTALAGCSSAASAAKSPGSASTISGSVVLAGDGVASVRFGESTSAAIAGLDRLLGNPPKGPVSETGNCNIDAAQQWSGLTGFFNKGEFVGYSTGERLTHGNIEAATGLRVGDTVARAQRIYGSAFQTSLAQGGSWSVPTRSGKLIGYLSAEPDQPGPVATITSIEAGSVGCPAATP